MLLYVEREQCGGCESWVLQRVLQMWYRGEEIQIRLWNGCFLDEVKQAIDATFNICLKSGHCGTFVR